MQKKLGLMRFEVAVSFLAMTLLVPEFGRAADGPPPPSATLVRSWAVAQGNGNEYLVVWTREAEQGDADIVGVRFADGKQIDPAPVVLVSGEGNQYNPTVGYGWLEDGFYVYRLVWEDDSTGFRRVAQKTISSTPGGQMVFGPDEMLEIQIPDVDLEEFHPDIDCTAYVCLVSTIVRKQWDGSDFLVMRQAEPFLGGSIPFLATFREYSRRYLYEGPKVAIANDGAALVTYHASWHPRFGVENRIQRFDIRANRFDFPDVYDWTSWKRDKHSYGIARRSPERVEVVYETSEPKLWRKGNPPSGFTALAQFDSSGVMLGADGLSPQNSGEVEMRPAISRKTRLLEQHGSPIYHWSEWKSGLHSRPTYMTKNFETSSHSIFHQPASAGSGAVLVWGLAQWPPGTDGVEVRVNWQGSSSIFSF
ncbi:MAG TPA: hypothetical protein VN033_09550 [Vulgatibacter sp.]|nr:hypothetical protein [Vulgatibacter sp.]